LSSSEQSTWAEAQVDVRRYLGALRRNRRLMAGIVILITGTILLLSLILPKTYEATARIVLDVETGVIQTPDAETVQRRLATIDALLSSSDVQRQAADKVPGETQGSISSKVDSSVDPTANLIDISASDRDPDKAAAIANAVANTFLATQRQVEEERIGSAISSLEQQLDALGQATGPEADAIRERITALQVEQGQAGSELQLAEAAEAPSAPASPKPFRNTILAFFAALFIAVLVALGRDQLRPAIGDSRELSRLLGAPVLAGVPYVGRRRLARSRHTMSAVEHEAYQTLRAALELSLPPGENQVILITSALHSEGKTTVAARLGQALAQAGHRTLVVSADLRWPGLHRVFDLPPEPGLSDVLSLIERAGVSDRLLPATAHDVAFTGMSADQAPLQVMTSGRKPPDPARLLSSRALHSFLEHLRNSDYSYVLIDAPPMLGIADVQPLAREADQVILVSRLDRVTVDNVIDMEELLRRLEVRPLGLVAIGVKSDVPPSYYLTERRPDLIRPERSAERASRAPTAYAD
jgi:capsular exopolysaccharide synthesis family protein